MRCCREHAGDKAQAFLHHRTLSPRHQHLPPNGEKCYPCVRYDLSPISQVGDSRIGGEGGIRTPDTVARMPHFECGAFNHSATSPVPVRRVSSYRRICLMDRLRESGGPSVGAEPGAAGPECARINSQARLAKQGPAAGHRQMSQCPFSLSRKPTLNAGGALLGSPADRISARDPGRSACAARWLWR